MGGCCGSYERVEDVDNGGIDEEQQQPQGGRSSAEFDFTLSPRAPCCVNAPLSTAVRCSNVVATASDLRQRLGDDYRPGRDDYDWLIVHLSHAVFCRESDEDYARVAVDALDAWANEAKSGRWHRRRNAHWYPF